MILILNSINYIQIASYLWKHKSNKITMNNNIYSNKIISNKIWIHLKVLLQIFLKIIFHN